MSDELEFMFDEVAGADDSGGDEFETLSRNATIYGGDDEEADVSDETTEVDDDDQDENDADGDNPEDESDDESDESDESAEFDFDSVKHELVAIRINGQTEQVPLAELRNGFMRQADYTRKTQEVAQQVRQIEADMGVVRWAQEMQNAFRTNPEAVYRQLGETLGLLDDDSEFQDLDPEVLPLAKELKKTQRELQALQGGLRQRDFQQADADIRFQVENEVSQMKASHTDFDPEVILPIAIEMGSNLSTAYRVWKAEQFETNRTKVADKATKASEAREKARKGTKQVAKTPGRNASRDRTKAFDSFEEMLDHEFDLAS